MNSFEQVREFHKAFDVPIVEEPSLPSLERQVLRLSLVLEEAIELVDAMGFPTAYLKDAVELVLASQPAKSDLVEVADALGDLEYVVNGAALEFGIPLPEVVAEIHHSNMTKLDSNSDPILREDGKILKGPLYQPPRIAATLSLSSLRKKVENLEASTQETREEA